MHRRAVSGDTVLRLTTDDGGAAPSGSSGQSQAGCKGRPKIFDKDRAHPALGYKPPAAPWAPEVSPVDLPLRLDALGAAPITLPGARNTAYSRVRIALRVDGGEKEQQSARLERGSRMSRRLN